MAANAVQGMVDPTTCGPGGDLFALVHRPGDGAPDALNASGRGGSGLDAAALRSAGHDRVPRRSPAAVTAPGCVDGWLALARRHGTRPLAGSARPGHPPGRGRLPGVGGPGRRSGAAPAGWSPPRPRPPSCTREGGPPGQANCSAALASPPPCGPSAAEGREALYAGAVGGAITAASGGNLTAADLAREHADWVEPIGIEVFSHRLWTIPPNSQGYLTGAAAWLLEQCGPPGDPASPAFHHAVVECYRAVAGEGDPLVADPGHSPLPAGRLLDPERLRPLVATLRPDRAVRRPPARPEPGGTAYLAVLDAAGMGVSLIQSNFTGIGSGLSAGGTGVWLHNRGACFSLEPGHPNEAAPGKRPRHTLSPTLWTRDGRLSLLLGTRGGYQQPQYLLQMAALLFVAGLGPAAAQAQPRWHMEEARPTARLSRPRGIPDVGRSRRRASPAGPRAYRGPRPRGRLGAGVGRFRRGRRNPRRRRRPRAWRRPARPPTDGRTAAPSPSGPLTAGATAGATANCRRASSARSRETRPSQAKATAAPQQHDGGDHPGDPSLRAAGDGPGVVEQRLAPPFVQHGQVVGVRSGQVAGALHAGHVVGEVARPAVAELGLPQDGVG